MSATATATATSTAIPAPPRSRLRRLLSEPVEWLRVLLVPDRAVPAAVREGRYGGAMLLCAVMALWAGLTVSSRLDLTEQVMAQPAQGPDAPPPGETQVRSEREVAEELIKARSVAEVKSGLAAAALPAELALLALALYGIGRFVGGKPTLRRAMALASQAALPGAVQSGLTVLAASRRPILLPAELPGLVWAPLGGGGFTPAARLLAGLDPFTIWSVVLLMIGFPALAGTSRRKAVAVVLVCFIVWLLVTRLIAGAPPPPPGGPR
jgi:hypothetical protein